jgi:hypothetical protein
MSILTPTGRGHGIKCEKRQKSEPFEPTVTASVTNDEASVETQLAVYLRAKWMRAMGVPEDEIRECSNVSQYPVSLDDEIENLKAMVWIEARNSARKQQEK